MTEQTHQVGDRFKIHFVWRLPDDGDVIRAIFEAEVLAIIDRAVEHIVEQITVGKEAIDFDYWPRVAALEGQKITVAWEVAGGAPIYLRLATLTGEHDYFRRHNQEWEEGNLPEGFIFGDS